MSENGCLILELLYWESIYKHITHIHKQLDLEQQCIGLTNICSVHKSDQRYAVQQSFDLAFLTLEGKAR